MHDYISPWIGLPLAAFLWIVVLIMIFREPLMTKVNDFFAHRRHKRRERNRATKEYAAMVAYSKQDAEAVHEVYMPSRPRHSATTR